MWELAVYSLAYPSPSSMHCNPVILSTDFLVVLAQNLALAYCARRKPNLLSFPKTTLAASVRAAL